MEELGSPASYLTLRQGVPVFSRDSQRLGAVEHVLADADADIFDGIVFDASPGSGGHRFVDAPDVEEIYERGVVLKLDSAETERLPEPQPEPADMKATPGDRPEGDLQRKLRRAWDLLSGNY